MAVYELPFNASEIPVEKDFRINGTEFSYLIEYNEEKDFYTCIISDKEDNILLTSKLVYNGDLLHAGKVSLEITSEIIPFDPSGTYNAVNSASFGTVKIYENEL
jgi:hypothetical protein